MRVFLSHASSDKPVVRALYERLQREGFIDPWFDAEDLLPGQDLRQEIEKAVRASDVVILCLSRHLANKAGFLQKETKDALDMADKRPGSNTFIILVRLEECQVPERVAKLQSIDLFKETGYPRLIHALREHARVIGVMTKPIVAEPARFIDWEEESWHLEESLHQRFKESRLHQIFEELRKGTSLALIGEWQMGKSSMLEIICEQGPRKLERPVSDFIYLNMPLIPDEDDFFEALCNNLNIEYCRGYKLARLLRGKHYILCLDEIEKMPKERFSLEEQEELRSLADGAAAPLTLVIASSRPLDQLFPDAPGRTSPLANICAPLMVPPFTPTEARQFLAQRLTGTNITFTEAEIEQLIRESRGVPGRLQQLAAERYDEVVRRQALTQDPN